MYSIVCLFFTIWFTPNTGRAIVFASKLRLPPHVLYMWSSSIFRVFRRSPGVSLWTNRLYHYTTGSIDSNAVECEMMVPSSLLLRPVKHIKCSIVHIEREREREVVIYMTTIYTNWELELKDLATCPSKTI